MISQTSLLTLHLAAFYMVAVIGLPLVAFERRDIIFAVGKCQRDLNT